MRMGKDAVVIACLAVFAGCASPNPHRTAVEPVEVSRRLQVIIRDKQKPAFFIAAQKQAYTAKELIRHLRLIRRNSPKEATGTLVLIPQNKRIYNFPDDETEEIVAFAKAHHIEVIILEPSFNAQDDIWYGDPLYASFPGHPYKRRLSIFLMCPQDYEDLRMDAADYHRASKGGRIFIRREDVPPLPKTTTPNWPFAEN
jgi:hypothetical protein